MKVYIGADHRGYELKEKMKSWLLAWKHEVFDVGANYLDPGDDYTIYAQEVASLVAKETGSRGVLLCGSGVGVDVVANKFDGVRASIGKSAAQVIAGRKDDDMNVLVIAADYTGGDEAQKTLKAFLETDFDQKTRHGRRLEEIEKIEANN